MRIVPVAAAALLAAVPALAQEPAAGSADRTPTRITGTLFGANGEPMQLAHVSLYGSAPPRIAIVQAAPDGRYEMEIDTTGVFTLSFTGVDHLGQSVPLLVVESGGEIVVNVRLGTYEYRDDFSSVSVIGDFNGFTFQQDVRRMEPQEDGTYVLDVEVEEGADSLAYQLVNAVTGSRSINGTMSDWFVYDDGGDYRSVLAVEGGEVAHIRFDPSLTHQSDAEPEVRFGDPSSVQAEYAAFAERLSDFQQEYVDSMSALRERDAPMEEMRTYSQEYDWSTVRAFADSAMDAAADDDLRTVLLATYLSRATSAVDSLTARAVLAEIEPGSWKWTIGSDLMTRAIYRTEQIDAYADYVLAALRENPSEQLRASALNFLLMRAHRDEEKAEQEKLLFTWLVSEYPESFEARYAMSELDPARAIQKGRPVPAFTVADLEDSTVVHSNESMLGTTYLMDFWAVWCGPCIAELPDLHAAYEKYNDEGFTILSLSFDGSPQDVIDYRQGEFAMPWLHGFVEGGFTSELAKTFQIFGIPKPILVGADGVILETSGLRGDQLDATLAEVFGREVAQPEP